MATLVFIAAFCLYGLSTSQQPQGYEAETNAAAEGFVLTGDFVVQPDSPLRDVAAGAAGYPGKDGKLIGRAGLPSSLSKAPFYAVGWVGDELASNSASYTWRRQALAFANPFVVAMAAAFFLLVIWRLRRSMRWAIVMAGIFTAASIAWPYAKVGQETVLMTGAVLTLAAVMYAQGVRNWKPWAAAGFGTGLVLADKPYALLATAAMLTLLIRPFQNADRPTRRNQIIAFLMPLVAWGVAVGAFNWTRTGSATSTGRNDPELTLAAPLNAIGFFVSPGKGLLLYSPVVILGLLGLRPLWRSNRRTARAIAGAVVGAVAAVAILRFWSDETWGPRYIVWIAWLLLLPVPFWATSALRTRILGVVAAFAVAIQLLAVVAPPVALVLATKDLTGQPIFFRTTGVPLVTPFGRDPIRWIPELSPLLFQAKIITSYASQRIGGPALTTTYAPYEGPVRRVELDRETLARYNFEHPFIWWAQPDVGAVRLAALVLLLVGALSVAQLRRIALSSRLEPPLGTER